MDFKDAVINIIQKEHDVGYYHLTDHQEYALLNCTDFLNAIPDDEIMGAANNIISEIYTYDYKPSWTTIQPTKKPTDVIKDELKTVNNFLELLNKISLDVPRYWDEKSLSGVNEEYEAAQSLATKIKHDLEILTKTCKQSDLKTLAKERYYKGVINKKDIEDTIKSIMKSYSIAIDYKSIQEVRDFIARI